MRWLKNFTLPYAHMAIYILNFLFSYSFQSSVFFLSLQALLNSSLTSIVKKFLNKKVLAIECINPSCRTNKWSGELLQTGDIVEEIQIGDLHLRSPFTDGNCGVQKQLDSCFKSKMTKARVRVRRGESDTAELTAFIVPEGRKKHNYVLRAIDDFNYVAAFTDRTESDCLELQASRLHHALYSAQIQGGYVPYPKKMMLQAPNASCFFSILFLPKASETRRGRYNDMEDTLARANAWFNASQASGVPIVFTNIQTESLLTKTQTSGETTSSTVSISSFSELPNLGNASLYGVKDYHGVDIDIGVVRAIRLWYSPVQEYPVEIKIDPGDLMLGFAIRRSEEGFIYISSVLEGEGNVPSKRSGLNDLYRLAKSDSKLLVISRVNNQKVLPWVVSPSSAIQCFDTISLSQKLISLLRHAKAPLLLHVLTQDAMPFLPKLQASSFSYADQNNPLSPSPFMASHDAGVDEELSEIMSRMKEFSARGIVGTPLTRESVNPTTVKTHDSKVMEENEMDLSVPALSHNLNVHPRLKPALPPAMVADDAIAYTPRLSVDLHSPQPTSPFNDMVVDDALLYCSLFPPEYEFEKTTLLQLWLADGIFNEEPMEEIAGLFFEYCLARGYFEVSRTIYLTGEAMYTFKGDNCLVTKGNQVVRIIDSFNSNDLSPEVSHVSISCRNLNDSSDLCQFERFKQLRTLIFLQGHLLSLRQLPRDFFLSVELLRTLDLSRTRLEELPSSIGTMKCLRYLDLTKTPIKHLPEALECLENLQTLKLKSCANVSTLPTGMRKLVKLRHLDFDVLRQLRSMPEGMGALTNIRTLSAFIIGVGEGCCGIGQLKNMNNLSGSFCISGLQNVLTGNEAVEANLCCKSQLRKLDLRWSDSQDKNVVGHKGVLSSLQPNASVEELRISCYGGSELPSWICDTTFCRLVQITLFKCENCLVLPSVGQLPALKFLHIVGFSKLKVIDSNFYGGFGTQGYIAFPKLEKLTIQSMLSFEEWRDPENSYFPQLWSLTIKQCPKLFNLCTLSSLHSLKELEIAHCGMLASCLDEKVPPSLETFVIEECPLITARILEEEGQVWLRLLAQVPNVWIDHQEISGLNSSEGEEDESD